MAGGLRVSELTHLRWSDLDLREAVLNVAASKTAAGVRQVVLDPELVQLLREHKLAAEWSQPEDFVFAGRLREKPRERNSVRTRILYRAIEKANAQLAAEDRPPLPDGITFHALRRTYAALRAELGEHPAITAAQMGTPRPAHDPARLHRRDRDAAKNPAWRPSGRLMLAGRPGCRGHADEEATRKHLLGLVSLDSLCEFADPL